MKKLKKLPKTWAYVTHPLGHDPYNSYATSYVVNTETHELKKIREEIVNQWLANQEKRVDVATAGIYQPSAPAVAPFDGNPLA